MKSVTIRPAVLIIEDDKFLAQLNQFIFSNDGYEVFTAPSMKSLKEIFATQSDKFLFDLVLLDMMVPDSDGDV